MFSAFTLWFNTALQLFDSVWPQRGQKSWQKLTYLKKHLRFMEKIETNDIHIYTGLSSSAFKSIISLILM